MINPIPIWAKSKDDLWDALTKKAGNSGFDTDAEVTKMWQQWNNDNAKTIGCTAPLTVPVPLKGSTTEKNFSPCNFKASKSGAQFAQILADSWKAWASTITWTVIPPAPPFMTITSIITDPLTVTAAHSALIAGLIKEMNKVPKTVEEGKLKSMAFSELFYKAVSTLQVKFIGTGIGSPPPPLIIPVPVM
jgi:hypothetical protein